MKKKMIVLTVTAAVLEVADKQLAFSSFTETKTIFFAT